MKRSPLIHPSIGQTSYFFSIPKILLKIPPSFTPSALIGSPPGKGDAGTSVSDKGDDGLAISGGGAEPSLLAEGRAAVTDEVTDWAMEEAVLLADMRASASFFNSCRLEVGGIVASGLC